MIQIAIDGPGGAGKSTYAKALAKEFGFLYVDTGALYRAIGRAVKLADIPLENTEDIIALLPSIHLDLKYENGVQVLYLNGIALGDEIRTSEAGMYASKVSAIPAVRTFLLDTQRKIGRENNVVMDGRDIGTVIFPQALVKIFLFASPEARAKRRFDELTAKGMVCDYETILKDLNQRDEQDRNRETAPLKPAEDAVMVDNSNMTIQKCTDYLANIIRSKIQ